MNSSEHIKDPVEELKKLVHEYEAQPRDLMDVPQKYKEYFGLPCLANALMHKLPKKPQFESEDITNYITGHVFNSLDSLIYYVKSQKTDLNKLYAIFCWAANNLIYDVDSYFGDEHKSPTLEGVFREKKALCDGYSFFYQEMAKECNIGPNIEIKNYSVLAKGFKYNPLKPPNVIKSNHALVYLLINGVPFISEPTWAAGNINSNHSFERKYRPDLFLIPLTLTLCTYYPCNDGNKFFPYDFPFQDFIKASKLRPDNAQLKTESHPFVNNKSHEGYIEQQFSCLGPISMISYHIYQQDVNKSNRYNQINEENITSVTIIQKKIPNTNPLRCRFMTHIAFPNPGFYLLELYINTHLELENYFKIKKSSMISIPVHYPTASDANFIPITPKRSVSHVRKGVALIRFAVSKIRSECIWDIYKIKGKDGFEKGESLSRNVGQLIKLKIPFDDERYEDQLSVTFPNNGRYLVYIFLANDEGSYTGFVKYYFDVEGAREQDPISPVRFLFQGREFSPLKIKSKGIQVNPAQSAIIVNEANDHIIEIETPNGKNDDINLNFKKIPKCSTIFPEQIKDNANINKVSKYRWNIPEEGAYEMSGFINDIHEFSQYYFFIKSGLKRPTNEELELQNELKKVIDEDESKVLKRQEEKERQNKAMEKEIERQRLEKTKPIQFKQEQNSTKTEDKLDDKKEDPKKNSKCCLLI